MKTTCDDQRRVAESLRASTYSGEYLDKAVFKAIYGTMGEMPYPIGSVLADLIDPTCHIELRYGDSDHTDEPHYICSRCGKEGIDVYERKDFTLEGIISHSDYCSCCGARVVDFTIRME